MNLSYGYAALFFVTNTPNAPYQAAIYWQRFCSPWHALYWRLAKLPTIGDDDRNSGSSLLTPDLFNCRNDIHTAYDFAEHNVLPIQPRRITDAKKEL